MLSVTEIERVYDTLAASYPPFEDSDDDPRASRSTATSG